MRRLGDVERLNGSSNNNTRGSVMSARAIAVRWRIPPTADADSGWRPRETDGMEHGSIAAPRVVHRPEFQSEAHIAPNGEPRKQVVLLEDHHDLRGRPVQELAVEQDAAGFAPTMNPPKALSRVVLPQPDGRACR